MPETLETGDLFKAAYLLTRGASLEVPRIEGSAHVVLCLCGEDIAHQDRLYRLGKGSCEPLQLKESLNLLRDTVKQTLRRHQKDGRLHHADGRRRTQHAS